uniref:TTF-type domain-containing protein n=1 Tax=Amphimedon queenslandica TaxID=400682 RepID=A0A1X7V699_AMPQE
MTYPKSGSGGKKRCFQSKWFSLAVCKEWLEYSLRADAMFCFSCHNFATQNDVNKMGWIVNGVQGTNWKNATRAIKKHSTTSFHVHSMKSWKCYLEQTPVDYLLNDQRISELSRRQQEIDFNRKVVHRILEIIILLSIDNLSFPGHQESESICNRGNFLAIVHHQAKYDFVIKEHLENSKKNCHYLSPEIQNEFISLLANAVVDKIVTQVEQAKYFTLLLDETSDVSREEQVSFILRYVNSFGAIVEHFIAVTSVKQTDHKTLTLATKETFQKYGLSLKDLRGQGYNGAANMSGHYAGVQAMICKENSKAIYMHCHAHILNLVLVESCNKNNFTCNFFGDIQSVYTFINGNTKRHTIFIDMQKTE